MKEYVTKTKKRILFIIGNGFDLHFGLKTSTGDFTDILSHYASDIYFNALEEFEAYNVDWGNYEESLSDINLKAIEDDVVVPPDYCSDHESDRNGTLYSAQESVAKINDVIYSCLTEMVENAEDDLENIFLPHDDKDLFKAAVGILNFNYTSTIEKLYDLNDDILIEHIHGCYEDNDKLIFGYKKIKSNYINELVIEESDYYENEARKIIWQFYKNWRKKIKIDKLKDFLEKVGPVDIVKVYGHSLSAVDAEYMEIIDEIADPEKWYIYYYSKDSKKQLKENVKSNLPFIKDKVEYYQW